MSNLSDAFASFTGLMPAASSADTPLGVFGHPLDPGTDAPSPLPPFAPVDDATRAALAAQIDQRLQRPFGSLASTIGPALRLAGAPPWASLLAGLATRPLAVDPTRQAISGMAGDTIAGQIQDQIDRVNNAYGYQQLLNAGGFPR
jgi:hypothetical protein